MGLVSRLIGQGDRSRDKPRADAPPVTALADGAIDTLGSVIRTFGDLAFPLADGKDANVFRDDCDAVARHVENGAGIAEIGIVEVPGQRAWSNIRRFFADRRQAEKLFV
ncbi:MAG: hypothetical protein RLN77_00285, partial [Rhodospirillales bacterium]